jgi:preprotein translocase subunit YajC
MFKKKTEEQRIEDALVRVNKILVESGFTGTTTIIVDRPAIQISMRFGTEIKIVRSPIVEIG